VHQKETQNIDLALHRLAAGTLPPGGSYPETTNWLNRDESPDGSSSPARRFLENSKNPEKNDVNKNTLMHSIIIYQINILITQL